MESKINPSKGLDGFFKRFFGGDIQGVQQPLINSYEIPYIDNIYFSTTIYGSGKKYFRGR